MINIVWPRVQYYPKRAITLEIGDIGYFDFSDCAKQIFYILDTLRQSNLIGDNPYNSPNEVEDIIKTLLSDINLGSDEFQISERMHVRVEFRDELLSVETYIGV